jgi:hypothetical protein
MAIGMPPPWPILVTQEMKKELSMQKEDHGRESAQTQSGSLKNFFARSPPANVVVCMVPETATP